MTEPVALLSGDCAALSNAQLRSLLGFVAAELNNAVAGTNPGMAAMMRAEASFAVHRAVVLLGDDA